MPTQTSIVFPNPGIIDNQGIVNAVLCIVNFLWVVGIDYLDGIAVNHQRIAFIEHTNSALKGPVDRVPTQQSRTFFQIIVQLALANNNCAQAQHIAAARLINQYSRHQAAYSAKAIEHHILGLRQWLDI